MPLPFLNQNQMGVSVGGPIKKDKLFFYGTYEDVRTHQQSPVDDTILTAPARTASSAITIAAGVLTAVNLLTLRGISIDPVMASQLSQVPGASSSTTRT